MLLSLLSLTSVSVDQDFCGTKTLRRLRLRSTGLQTGSVQLRRTPGGPGTATLPPPSSCLAGLPRLLLLFRLLCCVFPAESPTVTRRKTLEASTSWSLPLVQTTCQPGRGETTAAVLKRYTHVHTHTLRCALNQRLIFFFSPSILAPSPSSSPPSLLFLNFLPSSVQSVLIEQQPCLWSFHRQIPTGHS